MTRRSSPATPVVDEFTRECLSVRLARKLGSADVIDVLAEVFILRARLRSSIPTTGQSSWPWPSGVGFGYVESFNAKRRDGTNTPFSQGEFASGR